MELEWKASLVITSMQVMVFVVELASASEKYGHEVHRMLLPIVLDP
jgi:hypothetical protein